MSANFYVVPTDYGRSLIRQAHQNQPMQLKNIVIGDANNEPFTPESRVASTALINQRASLAIQSITAVNATTLQVTATLPSRVGGFFIHEVGITDINDKLVYIGNYHGNYKPAFTQGASSDMSFYVHIVIDKSAVINVAPHDSILANQAWVSEQLDLMRAEYDIQLKILRDRVNENIPVGGLFITTIDFKTAEEVAEHNRYGTWERFGDGDAIVSMRHSAPVLGYEWLSQMGQSGGSYEHKLTINEMPEHKHSQDEIFNKFSSQASESKLGTPGSVDNGNPVNEYGVANVGDKWANTIEQYRGESQPHNNVQPSIVVGVWKRIK